MAMTKNEGSAARRCRRSRLRADSSSWHGSRARVGSPCIQRRTRISISTALRTLPTLSAVRTRSPRDTFQLPKIGGRLRAAARPPRQRLSADETDRQRRNHAPHGEIGFVVDRNEGQCADHDAAQRAGENSTGKRRLPGEIYCDTSQAPYPEKANTNPYARFKSPRLDHVIEMPIASMP